MKWLTLPEDDDVGITYLLDLDGVAMPRLFSSGRDLWK